MSTTSNQVNRFLGQVHQNEFVPSGAKEANAIVSIKSNEVQGQAPSHAAGLVVGFVGDGSGSMDGAKWRCTKQAIINAVTALPNGCEFFVIVGRNHADVVIETTLMTDATRKQSLAVLERLKCEGGTYFARWMNAAKTQFQKAKGAIKVMVFLTDGANQEGSDHPLREVLRTCTGQFQAECRGVGADFEPAQLRVIQAELGGSVDMVRNPEDLDKDFQAIINRAKSLSVSDVYLQIWTPIGAKIEMVKQVAPEIVDLTAKLVPGPNPRTQRLPTGAWAEENRDYHVVIKLDDQAVGTVGTTKLCARIGLVFNEGGVEFEAKLNEGGQIKAVWTDDEKQSAVINPKVANYTGQAELAERIDEGLKALAAGDEDKATRALQRANELADKTGNEQTQKLIKKIAEVDDKGTLRLKKNRDKGDVVELDTQSRRTKRVTS